MRRRPGPTLLTAWLIATGASLPDPAWAQAPASPTPLDEARELYREGRAAFDTADYDGAVALWTKAYAKLPDTDDTRSIRNDIVYNISTAQIEAYALDRDLGRLRRAEVLLRRYMDEYISAAEDIEGMVAETEKVRRRLREVQDRIAEAEAGSQTPAPATADPAPADAASTQPGEPAPVDRPRLNGLQIGGIVALSAVALTAGATIAGGVIWANAKDEFEDPDTREQGRKNHRTGSAVAISAGILTGALVVAGVTLLVVGKQRRQRRSALVPMPQPGGGGVAWSLVF